MIKYYGIIGLVLSLFTLSGCGKDDSVPAMLSAPQAAQELAASVSLKSIASAQAIWKQQDADGNGQSDYWTYDLSGLYRMKDAAGQARRGIDSALAQADARPAEDGAFGDKLAEWPDKPSPKSGYYFQVMEQDESGNPYNQNEVNGVKAANSSKWAVCAYPAEYGRTGRNTFIINETGTVYSKDTSGKAMLQWPGADPTAAGWHRAE